MTAPDTAFDLAGGETPPLDGGKTLDEVIAESRSRRNHRTASAVLVYLVVAGLLTCLGRLVFALTSDLESLTAAMVGMAASLIVSITALTVALAKYSFGMSEKPALDGKADRSEALTTPSLEAVKVVGEFIVKAGETLKGLKP